MVDHVTDTYEFEVKIIQHGNLEILNVIYPTQVEAGVPYTVSYDIVNNGGIDTCYGMIVDKATNSEIAGTRWQEQISSGSTITKTSILTGRATDLNARIEVGYYTE